MSLICLSEYIKKASEKLSMPWFNISKKKLPVDFHFEFLDDFSRDRVISDFKSGKTIYIPSEKMREFVPVNISDFTQNELNNPEGGVFEILNRFSGKFLKKGHKYIYNPDTCHYESL